MSKYLFILLVLFFNVSCEKKDEVVIQAPLDEVWKYVADSNNAKEWSVYFDHITPFSGQDGQVGAVRRCFRKADESGNRWDETTLEVRPKEYRKIHTYNLYGFPEEFTKAEFHVHQRFVESADKKSVTLSFGSELLKPRDPMSLFKFMWNVGEVSRVIKLNLANIKEAIESRHQNRAYVRPHAYEQEHAWDQK